MHRNKRSALFVCALSAMLVFAWTAEADAQRRRGGRRRVARPAVRVNVGFGYRPFFYGGFYSPYYYQPYGYYYGPPYVGAYYEPTGALRVQVKPEATEVWVDGYLAGVADSFDGFFQRLRLPPGEYDIELRLDGYRSVRERVLLSPGSTFKIEHFMEPLQPGETTPPPPEPIARELMPPDRRTRLSDQHIHPSDVCLRPGPASSEGCRCRPPPQTSGLSPCAFGRSTPRY